MVTLDERCDVRRAGGNSFVFLPTSIILILSFRSLAPCRHIFLSVFRTFNFKDKNEEALEQRREEQEERKRRREEKQLEKNMKAMERAIVKETKNRLTERDKVRIEEQVVRKCNHLQLTRPFLPPAPLVEGHQGV